MNLLNHNIKINEIIYHVQTEVIPRKLVYVISSLIYQDGEIIWSSKIVLAASLSDKELEVKAQNSHKKAISHLRDIFSGNQSLNVLKLNNLIKNFRETEGKGLFSIELFRNDTSTLLAAYNPNRFATHVYVEIYKSMSKSLKLLEGNNELDYYVINLDDKRAIIVGDIDPENNENISYGILVNFDKLTIAMFLNTVLPKFINLIKDNI